jgi:hypothetical protein
MENKILVFTDSDKSKVMKKIGTEEKNVEIYDVDSYHNYLKNKINCDLDNMMESEFELYYYGHIIKIITDFYKSNMLNFNSNTAYVYIDMTTMYPPFVALAEALNRLCYNYHSFIL